MDINDVERLSNGRLPAYTSVGSYTMIYVTKGGSTLCADCATEALNEEERYDPPILADTYDEGPDLSCDECSNTIESSYGDPNEDEDED